MAITTPNVDTTRRFTVWKDTEIYTGPEGTGQWVPNVDDMVLSWTNGFFRVISVDHYRTNLSYLQKVNIATLGGGIDDSDIAVVTGVGANSNAFRIYVDTSTVPHTLAVDARVIVNGENSYVKIFKGTDTSAATGKVVSAMVNTSGKITSENIPLINAVIPSGTNVSRKTPMVAWCSETVKDGDICTMVVYTAAGQITSIDKFVFVTTNLVRTIDQVAKYVTNIELITPFLSKTDTRLVECPINMIMQSLNFTAKVTYSDNSSRTTNIDGLKWNIAGLDMFVASQIGKTDKILLTYNLSAEEFAFDATAALPDRKVVKEYRIKTVDIDTYYSIKLFAVPVWNSSTARYTLSWYLYNLERTDVIDVTSFIEYATTSPTFVGNKYNGTQQLQVAFNMQNLGPSYSYFRHVQTVEVSLVSPATSNPVSTYYTLSYVSGEVYGVGVKATFATDELNSGKTKLNIGCGYTDPLLWLDNLYYKSAPLHYSQTESRPPAPTHARVLIGTGSTAFQREIAISEIVSDIRNINLTVGQGNLVRVELFYRSNNVDSQLAVVPMIAAQLV